MSLVAFLVVGALSLNAGEELVWAVGKAIISFFICWIVSKNLGRLLSALITKQEAESTSNTGDLDAGSERG
jgi:hypothetical protein